MSIDRLQQCIRDKKNPSMVSLDPVADRLPPQLIEQAGIVKAAVAQQVIENFNPMVAASGEEMQTWVAGYLEMLYEIAPDAVGGTLPDEGFYYLG